MFDTNCLFCKIIQKQIPSKIIAQNDYVMVIEDIHPKAPFHYLVLPKKHIENLNHLTDQDSEYGWQMLKITREVAKKLQEDLKQKESLAFNLISNNGVKAGQSVLHLHWHFLAGKNIYTGGFQL